MKRQLLVICKIYKWQGLFIQNDSLVSIKQLMVIFKRKNSRCSIHYETSQGTDTSIGMRICFTHIIKERKAIKLNMYYEYHFFLMTSMMLFVTSVSKRNHSHIKNRFSEYLPTESEGPKWWNSSCSSGLGDLASVEGAAKFHVRVWLKKRHFR